MIFTKKAIEIMFENYFNSLTTTSNELVEISEINTKDLDISLLDNDSKKEVELNSVQSYRASVLSIAKENLVGKYIVVYDWKFPNGILTNNLFVDPNSECTKRNIKIIDVKTGTLSTINIITENKTFIIHYYEEIEINETIQEVLR